MRCHSQFSSMLAVSQDLKGASDVSISMVALLSPLTQAPKDKQTQKDSRQHLTCNFLHQLLTDSGA
jgi:hypothetical protein